MNKLAAAWSILLALGTVISIAPIPLICKGSLMLWKKEELFLLIRQRSSISLGLLRSFSVKYWIRNFSLCMIVWACSLLCFKSAIPLRYGFGIRLLCSGWALRYLCLGSRRTVQGWSSLSELQMRDLIRYCARRWGVTKSQCREHRRRLTKLEQQFVSGKLQHTRWL